MMGQVFCAPVSLSILDFGLKVKHYFRFLSFLFFEVYFMIISDRIKEICKERGISLSKIEKEIGLGNGTIGMTT